MKRSNQREIKVQPFGWQNYDWNAGKYITTEALASIVLFDMKTTSENWVTSVVCCWGELPRTVACRPKYEDQGSRGVSVAVRPRTVVVSEQMWLTGGEDLRRGQEYQEVGGGRDLAAGRLHVAQPLQGVLHLCRPGEETGKRTREGNKENNLLVEVTCTLPFHQTTLRSSLGNENNVEQLTTI